MEITMTLREHLRAMDTAWASWQEARMAVRWLRARCPWAAETMILARQDRRAQAAEYNRLRATLRATRLAVQ